MAGTRESLRARASSFPPPLPSHSILIDYRTTMDSQQDMEQYLVNLEETFYQQGLASGLPHGHLHGLFEGRALGREKGWELWEEVGYYQGTATFWRAILQAQGKQGIRCAPSQTFSSPSQLTFMSHTTQGLRQPRASASHGRLVPHRQRFFLSRRSQRRSTDCSSQRRRRHSRPPHLHSVQVPRRLRFPWCPTSHGGRCGWVGTCRGGRVHQVGGHELVKAPREGSRESIV